MQNAMCNTLKCNWQNTTQFHTTLQNSKHNLYFDPPCPPARCQRRLLLVGLCRYISIYIYILDYTNAFQAWDGAYGARLPKCQMRRPRKPRKLRSPIAIYIISSNSVWDNLIVAGWVGEWVGGKCLHECHCFSHGNGGSNSWAAMDGSRSSPVRHIDNQSYDSLRTSWSRSSPVTHICWQSICNMIPSECHEPCIASRRAPMWESSSNTSGGVRSYQAIPK